MPPRSPCVVFLALAVAACGPATTYTSAHRMDPAIRQHIERASRQDDATVEHGAREEPAAEAPRPARRAHPLTVDRARNLRFDADRVSWWDPATAVSPPAIPVTNVESVTLTFRQPATIVFGALAGFVGGYAFGYAKSSDCSDTTSWGDICFFDRESKAAFIAIPFGALGLLAGTVMYSATAKTEVVRFRD